MDVSVDDNGVQFLGVLKDSDVFEWVAVDENHVGIVPLRMVSVQLIFTLFVARGSLPVRPCPALPGGP